MSPTHSGGQAGGSKAPSLGLRELFLLSGLLLAQVVLATGCRKALVNEPFRDARAGFSLEVPKHWTHDADPSLAEKPVRTTQFIGDAKPQDEGIALGAVLTVTRLSRQAGEKLLAPTKALFQDDALTPATSDPYSRDYEHGGPTPIHPGKVPISMHVEGRVYRTPAAFFIVELRGVRGKFDQHRPALERALATFRSN